MVLLPLPLPLLHPRRQCRGGDGGGGGKTDRENDVAVRRGRRGKGGERSPAGVENVEGGSSQGWLQGPAAGFYDITRSVLTSVHQWDGFLSARSGQCPLVTLNRPAMQSGPSDGRMRRGTTLLPVLPLPARTTTRPAANPPPLPSSRRPATTLVGAGAAYAPVDASRCFNFFHPSPLSVSPLALVGRQNIVYVHLPPLFLHR